MILGLVGAHEARVEVQRSAARVHKVPAPRNSTTIRIMWLQQRNVVLHTSLRISSDVMDEKSIVMRLYQHERKKNGQKNVHKFCQVMAKDKP